MAKYLVTGAAGFIGSSLVRALLERGEQVRGIDNFSTGRRENLTEVLSRMDFREADLLDLDAMRKACAGVDYVVAPSGYPFGAEIGLGPLGSNRANIDGTLNVLVAARDAKVKRVVYAASSSAYGDTPTLPKHEAMTPNPISPYAVAKLSSELYMISFYRCYGLETVCLRYFNIFGPRQDPLRHTPVCSPNSACRCCVENSLRFLAMVKPAAISPTSIMPSRPICWPVRPLPQRVPGAFSIAPPDGGSR